MPRLTHSQKIEKLKMEKEKNNRMIEKLEHRQEQLEHQINQMDKRAKYIADGERKQRTHRLITKGAAIESIAPMTKDMTEPEFYELMEKILSLPDAEKLLAEIAPPQEDAAVG